MSLGHLVIITVILGTITGQHVASVWRVARGCYILGQIESWLASLQDLHVPLGHLYGAI